MGEVLIKNVLLQPRQFFEIDASESISLISGGIPRVIVRAASHAFDLIEGQTLPVPGVKAQIINPFSQAAWVNIAQGLPLRISATNGSRSGTRHEEQTGYFCRMPSGASDPAKRIGIGFMATKGRYLITPTHQNIASENYRVTVLNGADLGFLPAKPAGVMEEGPFAIDYQNNPAKEIVSVGGLYTDADMAAWIAAAGYPGVPVSAEVQMFNVTSQRWICDARTAVFFTRAPGLSMTNFRFRLEDMGVEASEYF